MKIARSSTMAWLMTQCIALVVTVPILHVRAAEGAAGEQKVRPAAVAGAFYPADPQELSKMIDDMLAKATPPPVDGTIIAAVAPHAGYPYSGPVAAWTYAAIGAQVKAGHKYTRVVVIAPSHYVGFDFTSVYDGDAYTTPLGQVPVDKEFARRLAKMSSTIQLSDKGHQATADAPEHSVEVELPWLQKILGNFELVPIVMGDQSYESSRALGVALAKMLRNDHDTLVLASSDLSHYHPYADAESDRPQDAACARGVRLLQHVAQLPISRAGRAGNLGGLRRRAHCGRHDLCRATWARTRRRCSSTRTPATLPATSRAWWATAPTCL